MIKEYFHKATNGTRISTVTATVYCGKRFTLVELRMCVLLKGVNIPQFKTQTQNAILP